MKKEEKKKKSIAEIIKSLREKYGDGAAMILDDKVKVDKDAISTGSIGLDYAIGIGGLPRGRIVEIYGPESSGKTTLALHVIAEAQKIGGKCAFIDAEHALDPVYAGNIGVETTKLIISQPENGEEALQITDDLVRGGDVDVIVVDSVAALTPKAEIEGEIGSTQVALQARMMSQAMRVLTASVARTNTLVIFINQVRTNIGGYGNPETTSGGRALKFYASVRIDVRRISSLKKGEVVFGGRIKAKIVKNKVASPFRVAEYDLIFNEGISREGEIMLLGELYDVMQKTGITYTFGDVKLAAGAEKTRDFLKDNKELADKIAKTILEKMVASKIKVSEE